MLIYKGAQKEIGAVSQLGAEKITFPPNPDIHTYILTDRHTEGRTDICFYRVAFATKKLFFIRPMHFEIRKNEN